jgi:two-component system sensor kinase FixL
VASSDLQASIIRLDRASLSRPEQVGLWLLFVILYCGFDRFAYFIPPIGSRETAWDLSGGMALALLLWRGPRAAPLVFVADVASSLITPTGHPPLTETVGSALALTVSYSLAALYVRRNGTLQTISLKTLLELVAAAALAALARAGSDFLIAWPWSRAADAVAAISWDGLSAYVGMLILAPFAIVGVAFPRPRMFVEGVLQLLLLGAIILLVFPLRSTDPFQQFYLLFLPQMWIAVRSGLSGAAFANAAVQLALIVYFLVDRANAQTMFNYDYRLLALVISTLLVGAAVSERKRFEAELRQRQDQLARVSRLSLGGEMAAALAHELNQPLTASIAFSRTAQRLIATDQDGASEAMNEAVVQSERAAEIIRSLRRFVGKSRPERKPYRVSALTRDSLALAEPLCAKAGAALEVVGERPSPNVLVDAVQIQQVLLNLIQNAVDASHPGPKRVTIGAWAKGADWVEVEVKDNGPGVPPAAIQQLFEPFSSAKPGGVGLGLTICRGIVEAHGGRIWLAENRPGACAFRFTLPQAGGRARSGARS